MKFLKSRTGAVLAGTTTLVVLGGTGAAMADGQITSGDIKNGSIFSRDIADQALRSWDLGSDSVGFSELKNNVESSFAKSGHNHDGRYYTKEQSDARYAQKGDIPAPGEDKQGLHAPAADGPYTFTWKGDNGQSLQEAVVKCPEGEAALGGGFSQSGGAQDLGGESKDIQITVSAPYFEGEYKPVDQQGRFVPTEWVIKGYNNGNTDQVVRPWVVCAKQ